MEEINVFYCMVVGTRTFTNYRVFKNILNKLLQKQLNTDEPKEIVIVSGGAKGADALAEQYAKEYGYTCKVFPADWDANGKAAGFIRNRQMHEYVANKEHRGVVAFWDEKSAGTSHSFALAIEYNNPIRIYDYVKGNFIKNPAENL